MPTASTAEEGESFQVLKAKMITQFERAYIREQLHRNNGNITKAAKEAGKHRRAFWELMRRHDITVRPHVPG